MITLIATLRMKDILEMMTGMNNAEDKMQRMAKVINGFWLAESINTNTCLLACM